MAIDFKQSALKQTRKACCNAGRILDARDVARVDVARGTRDAQGVTLSVTR